MGKLTVEKNVAGMQGLCVIIPQVYIDHRGSFMESYNQNDMMNAGLDMKFVQDNQAISVKGVLRGLHVNRNQPQGKLIRCIRGAIFDVVVDLRNSSNTYRKWYGIELSQDNHKQLYIPAGFAHGYLVLSDIAEVAFKVTSYWHADYEVGILWNSPDLNIQWPSLNGIPYILNEKDAHNKPFTEIHLGYGG